MMLTDTEPVETVTEQPMTMFRVQRALLHCQFNAMCAADESLENYYSSGVNLLFNLERKGAEVKVKKYWRSNRMPVLIHDTQQTERRTRRAADNKFLFQIAVLAVMLAATCFSAGFYYAASKAAQTVIGQ